jgi:hypothetical protein
MGVLKGQSLRLAIFYGLHKAINTVYLRTESIKISELLVVQILCLIFKFNYPTLKILVETLFISSVIGNFSNQILLLSLVDFLQCPPLIGCRNLQEKPAKMYGCRICERRLFVFGQ